MTYFGLAFAYLRRRWGQALLSVIVGALGIAAAGIASTGFDALPAAAERSWGGVDVVIGPKGSALDLVLCCALHISDPRGLISVEAATEASHNPFIRVAAPIALGDNIQGSRIVGTTPEILSIYHATFKAGGVWSGPLQAVLGDRAARILGLRIGDSFVGAHGLSAGGETHDQFPYKVVGILAPTGTALDRLVLCDIETVRTIHREHEREEAAETGVADTTVNLPDAATAIIAAYRSPVAATFVPRQIERNPAFTAASPSFEFARLMGYLRPLTVAATAIGVILVGIAVAGAAAGLTATMNARTRDLALLRVLGASPMKIAGVALAEAGIIAAASLFLGIVLISITVLWGQKILVGRTGLVLVPNIDFSDAAYLVTGTIVTAVCIALFPAVRAARSSMEELLS